MLLAIDIGNTDSKFGVSDGETWVVWRRPTDDLLDLSAWLKAMFTAANIPLEIDRIGCASVVPRVDPLIKDVAKNLFNREVLFINPKLDFGVKVRYTPPESLGADRLANCLGALKQFTAPMIIVDFGSATTFDVVRDNAFIGGAIMPGVRLQADILAHGTANLPDVPVELPAFVIGTSTSEAIQSGIVLGHISAVEGMVKRIQSECDNRATVIATGGLAHLFIGATDAINHYVPNLTLDGIASTLQ